MKARRVHTSNKRSAAAIAFDGIVGERIKERRLKLGVTQGALVSVTGGSVSRYESGELACPLYKLALIAKLLDCQPGFFLNGIEP